MGQDLQHMNVDAISYITITTAADLLLLLSQFEKNNERKGTISIDELEDLMKENKIHKSGTLYLI